MRIADVMTRTLECVPPEATLAEAAQRMRDADVGALPVVCDGRPIGMVTDRDITIRAAAACCPMDGTTVAEVMTDGVVCCTIDEPVEAAAEQMRRRQVRRLLVVDHDDRLAGIVSLGDLAMRQPDEDLVEVTLEEVSSPGHTTGGVERAERRGGRSHGRGRRQEQRRAGGAGMNGEAAGALPTLAAGAALGAGAAYLFDPNRGRRRRAMLRDQVVAAGNRMRRNLGKSARYARGQLKGVAARAWSGMRDDEPTDIVLIERVRSAIGRAASHPGSIEVDARDGVVTVSGPILADEADALLDTVARVRGVRDVVDRLDVRASSGNTPGLQGAGRRDERRMGGDRDDWSPTARIAAGAFALGLGAVALQRRMPLGVIVGGLGAGLLARSATNLPARRLTGVGGGRRAIDVHKTVHLNASVDMVFDFWSNWQNFPRFMTNVREVRDLGGGRSHWVVAGPAGNVSWDAELTAYEPNRRIAWKSVPGSIVQHAGFVRFQPGEDGRGTRLDIQISYNPPGGAIGHALARVFGADPKSEMDADLMRMKTFIETGKTPHDAAQPSTIGMSCPLS